MSKPWVVKENGKVTVWDNEFQTTKSTSTSKAKEQMTNITEDKNEHNIEESDRALSSNGSNANEERGYWDSTIQFLLTCLSYTVGLGNVWRFPYLAYKNGRGAFFIPYFVMLAIVGIPIFLMEQTLGQFSSNGPITCWKFAELFQGVGFGMVLVSFIVCFYYNVIVAWCLEYFFKSLTDDLDWSKCRSDWAGPFCGKPNKTLDFTENNCSDYGWIDNSDGSCRSGKIGGKFEAIYNRSIATANKVKRTLPSEDYFYNEILGYTAGKVGLEDMGEVRWLSVLFLFMAWLIVAVILRNGIKMSSKVVWVTAILPFVMLTILFLKTITLDGAYDGVTYYIKPNIDRLTDGGVWKDAATQIFFSLSNSAGGLIALSSFKRYNNNVFRDAMFVSLGDSLTSVFAGFVIFSYLGFLAKEYGIKISEVAQPGPALTFVVIPMALIELPGSSTFSILFFFMFVTLGVGSELVIVETVITSILDMLPKTRKHKKFVSSSVCFFTFLFGVSMCFEGGIDLLTLIDHYACGWNVLVISICECIAVAWVYGIKRFLNDIESMIGNEVCSCVPWKVCKWWWACCLCFLTPVSMFCILIFSLIDTKHLESHFPIWADYIGWMITLSIIVIIFGTMIYKIATTRGGFKQRIRYLTTPQKEWGPFLPKHRELYKKYVPDIVVYVDQSATSLNPASCHTF